MTFRRGNWNKTEKRSRSKRGQRTLKSYRATVDEKTAISIHEGTNQSFLILKKELYDYHTEITCSEAPILSGMVQFPEPFEFIVADPEIIEKEIESINTALKIIFGQNKDFALKNIKLSIGSSDNDFVTIDEKDLGEYNVVPTINGLLDFMKSNEDSILGLAVANYEPERGNLVFFDAQVKEPEIHTSQIQIKIINSLQQRGIMMQKKQSFIGLQLYVIIVAKEVSESSIDFLRELGVDWELLQTRRELSIMNWIEIESERNAANLKAYLRKKYSNLNFLEISNIVAVCIENQLNFKIAEQIAQLLLKLKRKQLEQSYTTEVEPLSKEQIAAAAKVASAYHGLKRDLVVENDLNQALILQHEKEITQL